MSNKFEEYDDFEEDNRKKRGKPNNDRRKKQSTKRQIEEDLDEYYDSKYEY